MDRTPLQYTIDAEGRYADASAALLEATGYSLEEFRSLVVGQLSTASPDAAREGWRRYLEGEVAPRPVPVLVRRKDGRLFDAIFQSLEGDRDSGTWVVTLELVRLPEEGVTRSALTRTLADWRAAERHLASLGEEDPLRSVVAAQVNELRDRYRELQRSTS